MKGAATVSIEDNKATVRRVADEIFSQGKLDVIDDIFAPTFVGYTQHGTVIHGSESVKQFVAQYLTAFSNAHSVVEDQVAEGDRVVVRLTFTGTHTGTWMGIPPTGKPVTVKGMALYRALITASATLHPFSLSQCLSRRTERRWRYLDGSQNGGKHRAGLLPEKSLRRGRAVRTREEKVVHSCQARTLSRVSEPSQLVMAQ